MKQGRYDLQASKISEMMKSSSLDVFPLYLFLWLWFISLLSFEVYLQCPGLMFDAECSYAVTSKRREWNS